MTKPEYVAHHRRNGTQYTRVRQASGSYFRVFTEEDKTGELVYDQDVILYDDVIVEPMEHRTGPRPAYPKKSETIEPELHRVLAGHQPMTLDYLLGEVSELRHNHPDFEIILEIRSRESAL